MTIDNAIQALESAFPPHPIDPSRAFSEWGGTYLDAEKFRQAVVGKTWTQLSSATLEWFHDALPFLGPSAIADYLPAYVAALLRREPQLSIMPTFLYGTLNRGYDTARFDEQFAKFSSVQRAAVGRALEALEADVAGTHRQADVTSALESHWRRFASGQGAQP